MVSFKLSLAIFVVAFGLSYAQLPHYSKWRFEPVDSEEHGQFAGVKRTNCSCGTTNKIGGRIVGGKFTAPNEYPHMAGLARGTPSGGFGLFCGSTIVTPHHAITAAHCTADLPAGTKLAIFVGGHDMQNPTPYTKIYDIANFINHQYYSPGTFKNDISLLLVPRRIAFNEFVGPACLPTRQTELVQKYVKVTGWGHTRFQGTQSRILQKVNLKVVPKEQCTAQYPGKGIDGSQFCTYGPGQDSCQGDSGGPVTWLDPETNRYTLVGVVSFGRGCATEAPGVNTDVLSFMPWIQENIARTNKYTESSSSSTCAKRDY